MRSCCSTPRTAVAGARSATSAQAPCRSTKRSSASATIHISWTCTRPTVEPLQRIDAKQECCSLETTVEDKSNEITAIPALLDQLALQGSIVTLDAMGCQRAIAERILARGGDYLLTLKANHPLAQAAVIAHFEKHCFGPGASVRAACDAFEDSHGRLVRRRVFAST